MIVSKKNLALTKQKLFTSLIFPQKFSKLGTYICINFIFLLNYGYFLEDMFVNHVSLTSHKDQTCQSRRKIKWNIFASF